MEPTAADEKSTIVLDIQKRSAVTVYHFQFFRWVLNSQPQFQFPFFSKLVRSRASEFYLPFIDTLGFQIDHTVGKKTRLENDTDIGSRAPEMCLNIKAIDTWLPTLENFSLVKFCCHFPVAVYFFPPCDLFST